MSHSSFKLFTKPYLRDTDTRTRKTSNDNSTGLRPIRNLKTRTSPPPPFPPVLLTPLPPQVRTAYLGILMMCGLHGYLGYTQPLFVQGVMGLKNLYDAKLVRIYVLGRAPEGDLKRPFKTGPGMFGGEFRSSFASFFTFYFLPSYLSHSLHPHPHLTCPIQQHPPIQPQTQPPSPKPRNA